MGLVIAFFLTVLSFPLALDGRDEEGQLVEVMRVKSSSDSELSGETGACREGLKFGPRLGIGGTPSEQEVIGQGLALV
jgi:hypothetical protein